MVLQIRFFECHDSAVLLWLRSKRLSEIPDLV